LIAGCSPRTPQSKLRSSSAGQLRQARFRPHAGFGNRTCNRHRLRDVNRINYRHRGWSSCRNTANRQNLPTFRRESGNALNRHNARSPEAESGLCDLLPLHEPLRAFPVEVNNCRWTLLRLQFAECRVACRWHDMRHSFISRLAEGEASDATIMSLAGHLSRKMMEKYYHTRNEAKRQAISALDRFPEPARKREREGIEGSPENPRSHRNQHPPFRNKSFRIDGGRGWNRTTNLSIKSRMLCQLSYASVRVRRPNVEQHSQGQERAPGHA
jgi:hypothetical protein